MTVKTQYPIPKIKEALDTSSEMQIFYCLAMMTGSHQLQMRTLQQQLMDFTTVRGYINELSLNDPTNAPITFQKAISEVLKKYL